MIDKSYKSKLTPEFHFSCTYSTSTLNMKYVTEYKDLSSICDRKVWLMQVRITNAHS